MTDYDFGQQLEIFDKFFLYSKKMDEQEEDEEQEHFEEYPEFIHVTAGPRWGGGKEGWQRREGTVRQYPKFFRGGG